MQIKCDLRKVKWIFDRTYISYYFTKNGKEYPAIRITGNPPQDRNIKIVDQENGLVVVDLPEKYYRKLEAEYNRGD